MKYIVFSYDDGTIHDLPLIKLMNKYNIKGTFNLNSNLSNYVWNYETTPIVRPVLKDTIAWYDGHEVCSHSATHPRLNECQGVKLYSEIFDSKEDLENLFNKEIEGFAIPFDTFDEMSIKYLDKAGYKYCRVPYIIKTDSKLIQLVPDALTFKDDIYKCVEAFINNRSDNTMLMIAGHSYEYYLNNDLDKLEEVFKLIISSPTVKSVTLKEALINLKQI